MPNHHATSMLDPADLAAVAESLDEQLEAEVIAWAGRQAALTCGWLLRIAELDRRNAWARYERRSMADWLSWRCGIDEVTARQQLRVGHALLQLPATREAFARGELSYSKVRGLVKVATAETEAELVAFARETTAAQLDRALAKTRQAAQRAEERAAARPARKAELSVFRDDDGGVELRGYLPPEQAAMFLHGMDVAAKEAAKVGADEPGDDPAGSVTGTDEAGDLAKANRGRALVWTFERFLACRCDRRRAPVRMIVHVDADTLVDPDQPPPDDPAGPSPSEPGGPPTRRNPSPASSSAGAPAGASSRRPAAPLSAAAIADRDPAGSGAVVDVFRGGCHTSHGITLPPSLARRFAADPTTSVLTALIVTDPTQHHPEDQGRSARDPSAALRRAVWARDRGACTVTGCGRGAYDLHHITPWSVGGPTDYWNLTCICRHHHTNVHKRGWTLARDDAGRIVTRRADGVSPDLYANDTAVDHEPDVKVTRDGLRARSNGERMDLDATVTGLLCLIRPDLMHRSRAIPRDHADAA